MELDAYLRLMGMALRTWEIEALFKMDAAALFAMSKKGRRRSKGPKGETLVELASVRSPNPEGVKTLLRGFRPRGGGGGAGSGPRSPQRPAGERTGDG